MKVKSLFFILILIISCSKNINYRPYDNILETEDNGNILNPNSFKISSNTHFLGYFNSGDSEKLDKDFYFIEFQAQPFKIYLTGVPGVDSVLSIYDKNKKKLLSINENGIGEGEFLKNYYINSNFFYICVESRYGSNKNCPYILSVIINKEKQETEIEPNNTLNDANNININEPLKGYISPSSDVDFYKINFDTNKVYDFVIKTESLSNLDTSFLIIDKVSDESFIVNKFGYGGTEYSQYFSSNKGEFYIKVSGLVSHSLRDPFYIIAIEELPGNKYYEREFNNSFEKATNLIVKEEFNGIIENQDIDYYQFVVLNNNSKIGINVTGIVDKKFIVNLYDSNKKKIVSYSQEVNYSYKLENSGLYYLSIERKAQGAYLYKLFLTVD